jgi:two-component system sensor histidine kinase BaeS
LHTISLAEVGALDLRLAEADLRAVAEEAVAGHTPAAQLAGVALRADVSSEPVIVAVDAGATQRVLGNLVSNALRFAPRGSAVVVRVRDGAPGGRLEVADDGRGMGPELAAKAFDRFEKGPDSTGSGLGLAMARDLVEAQGGAIELSSTLGQGTRVSLSFPPPPAEP